MGLSAPILGTALFTRDYLSLPVYWAVCAPLAVATSEGAVRGAIAGGAVAGILEVVTPASQPILWSWVVVYGLLGAGVGVLGNLLLASMGERDRAFAETASLGERERLNRIVHDGVLQVLALMEREGPGLGPRGVTLAALAREQESRLRVLLLDRSVGLPTTDEVDVTAMLDRHESSTVTVSAMAERVIVSSHEALEIDAVVTEILANVAKHAGPRPARGCCSSTRAASSSSRSVTTARAPAPRSSRRRGTPATWAYGTRSWDGSATSVDRRWSAPRRAGELTGSYGFRSSRRHARRGEPMTETDGPRVMLVDDHPMWIDALSGDLEANGFRIVATASTGDEALRRARATRPDVMVMDLQIPDPDGATCTEILLKEFPDMHVLVISASGERDDVLRAIKAGAKGYLVKSATPEELLEGVRRTADGDAVFTPGLAGLVLGEFRRMVSDAAKHNDSGPILTTRETEVLRRVAKGMAYREIADELYVSHRTVQNHVQNVLRKLQLHNRVELTLYAIEQGYSGDAQA